MSSMALFFFFKLHVHNSVFILIQEIVNKLLLHKASWQFFTVKMKCNRAFTEALINMTACFFFFLVLI